MKVLLKIVGATAGIGILLFLLLVWYDVYGMQPFPAVKARWDARLDIAQGHYRQLGYGRPAAGRDRYATLLKQRYHVEFKAVAGCVVTKALTDYVDTYNSISMTAAREKFGHDIFSEVLEEAIVPLNRPVGSPAQLR